MPFIRTPMRIVLPVGNVTTATMKSIEWVSALRALFVLSFRRLISDVADASLRTSPDHR